MAYKDLRQFLGKLEEIGELKRIAAEVDWNDEIAAITEEALYKKAPAILFENIKDHRETQGRKVMVNCLASWKRTSLALDIPSENPLDIIREYRKRIKNPLKTMLLSTGPCKEVIHQGEDVNIETYMKTTLEGTHVYIKSNNRDLQAAEGEGVAQWAWKVTPLKGGEQNLSLAVSAVVEVPGWVDVKKEYPVFEEESKVKVSLPKMVVYILDQVSDVRRMVLS